MSKGGEVEGHVTSARGGALVGIEVCAWGVLSQATACATTNSGGTYLITGLPTGSFKVGFRPEPGSGLNYITQFYDDETSYKSANPIGVKAEEKKEGVNAAMAVGAEIGGTVTSGETGALSSETPVCVFGESEKEEVFSCAATTSSGRYTIAGLPTGSYTVIFFSKGPFEYYDQVFSESEAASVKVTAPEGDALNVDAVLPALPKRIVSPRVTGNAAVGGTLTCEEGEYGGVPAPTLSVQWLREGEPIEGATSPVYAVQPADAGHQLQCKVTAVNIMGSLWVKTVGIPIPVLAPVDPADITSVSQRRSSPDDHRRPGSHHRVECRHVPSSDHRPFEVRRRSVQGDAPAAVACHESSPCDHTGAGHRELLAEGRGELERRHEPHPGRTLTPGARRPSGGRDEAEGEPARRRDDDPRRLGDLISPRPPGTARIRGYVGSSPPARSRTM